MGYLKYFPRYFWSPQNFVVGYLLVPNSLLTKYQTNVKYFISGKYWKNSFCNLHENKILKYYGNNELKTYKDHHWSQSKDRVNVTTGDH